MPQLRIGVLGAARITEKSLVGPAHRGEHRLVVVAARDAGRAAMFAEQHAVERIAEAYDEVLADPEVNLVYNPLANGLHAPWNMRALRAGKAVLTEKPFAANAPEARQVADVARETGGTIMEAFHYAMHPVMMRLQEVVASGEIGDLRHIESTMIIPAPDDNDPRWSFDLAGGSLMDLGCYSLHAIRQLSVGGEPVVRSARGGERAGHPGVDEWIQAELDLPGGTTASLFTHMAGPDVVMTLTAIGTTGRVDALNFVLPHTDDRLRIVTADGERIESLGTRSSYDFQLDAVAAAVLDGTPLPLDVEDAVATMELIDATYLAAGFPVRPSQQ